AWHEDFDDVVVGYNAYSPAGDVTADVVYVNYGLPEDYATLKDLGVDVEGKIVLARYGNSFRGVKSQVAEEHGAAGVILYSDPADDGFTRGPVYPDGPWRNADGIQRGSVQYLFRYPGDPLTPGAPSIPGTPRLDPADAENLPRIPTTPISYGQARYLLAALDGPRAPKEWQGGLDLGYRIGPGPTTVHLDLDIDYEQIPINDVI
ncbi:aminopeptidase, partial [Klebsiella pneumoniae]